MDRDIRNGLIGGAIGCVVAALASFVFGALMPEPYSMMCSFLFGMVCGSAGVTIGMLWS